MGVEETQPVRAGYRSSGPPPSLSVARTMRNSLSRRTALGRPRPEEIAALEAEIARLDDEGGNEEKVAELREELARKQATDDGWCRSSIRSTCVTAAMTRFPSQWRAR